MIPIAEAFEFIDRETATLGTEKVSLSELSGRVLAEDIVADSDMPPFDRSQMDGFALRSADVANAPVELRIAGESAAGRGWQGELRTGEAVRIMTGAPVPAGADAVQKLESTTDAVDFVKILEPVSAGNFIIAKGAETAA